MSEIPDPRHIENGREIPGEGYADQPYIVRTDDGAWLCVMTTGPGHEGQKGQHIVATRSTDRGRTWSDPVAVEPSDGPEASYAVLLKVPGGRVYCFYNHNTDRVEEVRREDGEVFTRVDSLGHYVFRYSDDHGRTWSDRRYDVPVREFACDRENVYGGDLRFFWNVGKPLMLDDAALLVLHKVGAMGEGFFAQSEGAFMRSENILTESDPERIEWQTLPDGDIGLRAPEGGGRVAEEQSVTELSDGSLFCVYRTVDGWPACAYSRDRGHSWTDPRYLTYEPGGRRVKHPRAANFIWRLSGGEFLYWFHNHGGRPAREREGWNPYDDRNPAWLMAAREVPGPEGALLEFTEPEILLYHDDPRVRMSYPDLVEEGGRLFITETQKETGRVHEVPPAIVDGLLGQWERAEVAREGLLLELEGEMPARAEMPKLPEFTARDGTRSDFGTKDLRAGFTVDLRLHLDGLTPGQVLLDSREETGRGIALVTSERGALELVMRDRWSEARWDTDPGAVRAGEDAHLVAIVDGGPKIICFVVNGRLCDGGEY
ncbi:MAG: sialidase family protein, partial [Armatimonadota bacterium]